jgi:hypothetical protein
MTLTIYDFSSLVIMHCDSYTIRSKKCFFSTFLLADDGITNVYYCTVYIYVLSTLCCLKHSIRHFTSNQRFVIVIIISIEDNNLFWFLYLEINHNDPRAYFRRGRAKGALLAKYWPKIYFCKLKT